MNEREQLLKLERLYDLMYVLFDMNLEGKQLKDYFVKRHYDSVAVYGMGQLGRIVVKQFFKEKIDVKYVIDRNAEEIYSVMEIYKPDDYLQDVDIIVVTAITYFENIKKKLLEKNQCAIVSIEDIVRECL